MKATPIRTAGFFLALSISAATAAPAVHAASREGTIEAIQPIENRGEDTSDVTRRGRTWGERLGKIGGVAASAGLTLGGHSDAGLAVAAVAADKGDEIGGAIGERIVGTGPTTRYMVKVRLDKGRVLSLTQPRQQVQGLSVGSRVRVDGSGDAATLQALD